MEARADGSQTLRKRTGIVLWLYAIHAREVGETRSLAKELQPYLIKDGFY